MKPKAHSSLVTLVAVLVAAAAFPAATVSGDDPPPRIVAGVLSGEWTPPVPVPPPPPPVLKVLDGVEYALPSEGRSIIVEKVVPPPEPVPSGPPVRTMTPEQIAAAKAKWREAARRYRERNRMLMLSCTVYDHKATLVGWHYQGRPYRAWSNIDFNHIAGIGGFESGDGSTKYSLWIGLGNQVTGTRLGPTGRVVPPPEIPPLPSDGPGFVVIEGDATDTAALADMEAIHALYRAEGARLKASYECRERYHRAQAAWLKANPPQPHDTVIRYWKLAPEEAARIRREAP